MSATDMSLPRGFETLEKFAAMWAIEGANNRLHARLVSGDDDRLALFSAAKDFLAPGLDYLDQKPLSEFSAQDTRLMNLLLSMAHVSLAVEIQGSDEPKHAEGARYMTITRAPADV